MEKPFQENSPAEPPEGERGELAQKSTLLELARLERDILDLEEEATIMADALRDKDIPAPKKSSKKSDPASPFAAAAPIKPEDLARLGPTLRTILQDLKRKKYRRAELEQGLDEAERTRLGYAQDVRRSLARDNAIFPVSEVVKQGSDLVSLESAAHIMGEQFAGPKEILREFGFEPRSIPPLPYTVPELMKAKARGDVLVLRVGEDADGRPMTLRQILEARAWQILKSSANIPAQCEDGVKYAYGGLEYPNLKDIAVDPFILEHAEFLVHLFMYARGIFKDSIDEKVLDAPIQTRWQIIHPEPLEQAAGEVDLIQQTKDVRDALINSDLISLDDTDLEACTDEKLADLDLLLQQDRKTGAQAILDLGIHVHHRRTVAEVVYDDLVSRGKAGKLYERDRKIDSDHLHWDLTLTSNKRGEYFIAGVNLSSGGTIAKSVTPDGKKVSISLPSHLIGRKPNIYPWYFAGGVDSEKNKEFEREYLSKSGRNPDFGGIYLCY